MATGTTHFQDDSVSVESHLTFWSGQPGITARWPSSVSVQKCTARWVRASEDRSL